jgi:hypothetical protein
MLAECQAEQVGQNLLSADKNWPTRRTRTHRPVSIVLTFFALGNHLSHFTCRPTPQPPTNQPVTEYQTGPLNSLPCQSRTAIRTDISASVRRNHVGTDHAIGAGDSSILARLQYEMNPARTANGVGDIVPLINLLPSGNACHRVYRQSEPETRPRPDGSRIYHLVTMPPFPQMTSGVARAP